MNQPLPILATLLGLAGLLPFIGCGVVALGSESDRGAMALTAYGAVILAFLGAVHWGFALEDPAGPALRPRLALGVAPSLVGWLALLLAIVGQIDAGLGLLALGFVATTAVEARAQRAGLMPHGYMMLRYVLSAGVVGIVVAVLLLRLAGAHITLW